MGSCLEILDLHLSIARYLPNFQQLDGCILYLETSEELPTEGFLYRFIAALGELELLAKFQAILFGIPKTQFCGKTPPEGREQFQINQQGAVKKALIDYNADLPVIFNLNFGHTDPQVIIPSGGLAKIDGIQKTITFLN